MCKTIILTNDNYITVKKLDRNDIQMLRGYYIDIIYKYVIINNCIKFEQIDYYGTYLTDFYIKVNNNIQIESFVIKKILDDSEIINIKICKHNIKYLTESYYILHINFNANVIYLGTSKPGIPIITEDVYICLYTTNNIEITESIVLNVGIGVKHNKYELLANNYTNTKNKDLFVYNNSNNETNYNLIPQILINLDIIKFNNYKNKIIYSFEIPTYSDLIIMETSNINEFIKLPIKIQHRDCDIVSFGVSFESKIEFLYHKNKYFVYKLNYKPGSTYILDIIILLENDDNIEKYNIKFYTN